MKSSGDCAHDNECTLLNSVLKSGYNDNFYIYFTTIKTIFLKKGKGKLRGYLWVGGSGIGLARTTQVASRVLKS